MKREPGKKHDRPIVGRCPANRRPNGNNNAGRSRSWCIKDAGHKGKHKSDDGKVWQ